MNFPKFNTLVNPDDTSCYVAICKGERTVCSYKEILKLGHLDPDLVIGWLVPEDYVVLEISDLSILSTLVKRKEKVMLVQDEDKVQIYCYSAQPKATKNNYLACGLSANTYTRITDPDKALVLPFKNPKVCTSPRLANVEVLYGSEISDLPVWLHPVYKTSKRKPTPSIDLPIKNNVTEILPTLLQRIAPLDKAIQKDVLDIVNAEFCTPKLTDTELDSLQSSAEESFYERFFSRGEFLHHKLGDYIKESCYIKRDETTSELFYFNAHKNIYIQDSDYIIGYMTKLCPKLKNYQKEEVYKYIQHSLYDETVCFNANPFTVLFQNGVFDLTTKSFEQLNPDHLESIQISCNYNRASTSKIVDEFFATATNGDIEIERLLYEAIGYSMLKTSELQQSFILVGGGRNGKSTYLDMIRALLGERNTTSVSLKDLSHTFRASSLKNKLASLAGDISSQTITESDLVKSISGGERVLVEEKYKQATNESLYSTLFFACNKIPRTTDTSDGFYRRFTIIPFIADLSKVSRVDGMLFKKELLSPKSLEYVAWKALDAIYTVLNTTNEFTQPKSVLAMKEEYKIMNSAVLSWFKDIFKEDIAKVEKTSLSAAYISFSNWCTAAGRMKSSQASFKQTVKVDIGIDLS